MNLYNKTAGEIQSLDELKQQLATEKGITLIPIPFWWDGTKSRYYSLSPSSFPFLHQIPHFQSLRYSLIATIREVRSDVMNDSVMLGEGHPIPKEIPPHFLDKHIPHIEGIGEPTTATFFTRSNIDPTNWFPPPLFPSLPSFVLMPPLFSVNE